MSLTEIESVSMLHDEIQKEMRLDSSWLNHNVIIPFWRLKKLRNIIEEGRICSGPSRMGRVTVTRYGEGKNLWEEKLEVGK